MGHFFVTRLSDTLGVRYFQGDTLCRAFFLGVFLTHSWVGVFGNMRSWYEVFVQHILGDILGATLLRDTLVITFLG